MAWRRCCAALPWRAPSAAIRSERVHRTRAPSSPRNDDGSDGALAVEHLSVAFGVVLVLGDLSFSVARGTTLAIIGPNGAGKTVLLRALIGAVPSSGVIRWARGTRLGYVPQKLDLERDLPLTGFD